MLAEGVLTVTENLNLSALHGLRGARRVARVKEALSFAGLDDMASKWVRTYSGGMIRRLESLATLKSFNFSESQGWPEERLGAAI